jgi:hypothetical protein
MPNPFGGPPVDDGWARADELLRPAEEWLAREDQRYYPTTPYKVNPSAWNAWFADLPYSENFEDRRNAPPPIRNHTISQSIGEWPPYVEPEPPKASEGRDIPLPQPRPPRPHEGKVPKTPAEWEQFNRDMDILGKMYGRR